MLDSLITSKTRIKLLLKFFLNADRKDYLRNLESELGDNPNALRIELNKLEYAGFLKSSNQGNRKYFCANKMHPLFPEIHSILLKMTGIDELTRLVLNRVGNINLVFLTGSLAKGNDSEILDLIIVGDVNRIYLNELVVKGEKYIKKKIRFVIFNNEEFEAKKDKIITQNDLLIWNN